MNVSQLSAALTGRENGDRTEVSGIFYDSRRVVPGGVFFALKGVASDGHRHIGQALENGAVAVVVEDEASVPEGATRIVVEDTRLALSHAAAAFYGNPTDGMTVVAVTGTNGKTTTTYILEGILEAAGKPCAVLGTVSYRFRDCVFPSSHTTPESADLQMILREMKDRGAVAAAMEVSSHALEQKRVDGCSFDVAIFTNLTPEHLDYHGDMRSYLESKKRLFSELLQGNEAKPVRGAVVNMDDPAGAEIAAASAFLPLTYGLDEEADVHPVDYEITTDGIFGTIVTPVASIPFRSPLLGRFNLYNLLGAAAAGVALGISAEAIHKGLEEHPRVPGRLERVPNGAGVTVLVDYAHTGDALENVLRTVSEIATGRIVTVFGCGGDRDRTKRPVMGEIAGRYSDLTVVTSDNPRTEDPDAIIAEILPGLERLGLPRLDVPGAADGKGYAVIPDRREAIRFAASAARPGDILLLAGKGHEDYQIVGTEKHHFDDREEAAAAFEDSGR